MRTIMDDIILWVKQTSPNPETLDRNLRYINSLISEGKIDKTALQYGDGRLQGINNLHIDERGYIKRNLRTRA